ncbi:MAG: CsbD family protein [Myxococcales bacterium]
MNRDQIEGRWEQIKGRAKKAWAELTDDDIKRADGSVDKLYGIIQERFGDTKEAIKKKLDSVHL